VRSWQEVQIAMSTKTKKSLLPRANHRFCHRAPKEGVLPQWSSTAKENTRDVWSEGSRGGYGEGKW